MSTVWETHEKADIARSPELESAEQMQHCALVSAKGGKRLFAAPSINGSLAKLSTRSRERKVEVSIAR